LNDPALLVRVGVHSGYVVTHVIEADFSSIYEAGGPAVHLVKRLENAAQAGQILVSESCQSLAAGLVTFNTLPPRRLDGFSALVPCYELANISGLTRWRARSTKGLSSFVGRTEEISLLDRAARELGPSGQIVGLVGTAGIGKSRIAHEFVGALREKNWQVLEGGSQPAAASGAVCVAEKAAPERAAGGPYRAGRSTRPARRAGGCAFRSVARRALLGSRSAGYGQPLERSRAADAAPGDHRCRPQCDRQGDSGAADYSAS
jgi:hypothetical protein